MPTTTNFGWTTPADTDLVKDGASAMRTLGNGIDTSLVYLKGGTTGQILSKTSNTDLAFTWINNDQGDITAVTAGTGLSGGGTSGAVSLAIDTATTVDKTTAQTLTNKTLTAPIISTISNTGTLTLPTSTDTLVGRATTDTLTNKTISGASNTISNVSLTTGVTGTLPIANGGTGQTTATAATNALLPSQTGNSGKYLTTDGTNTSWGTVSSSVSYVGASVYKSASQSISNNTFTALTFNSEYFDTNAFHDTTTNTSRMTIPSGKAGKYLVNCVCEWDGSTTGYRQLQFYKNGVASFVGIYVTGNTGGTGITGSVIMDLAVGDYVEAYVYQNSGGNLSCYVSNLYGQFTVSFIGA